MMQRMEPFTLARRQTTTNEYREKVAAWTEVGAIRAALSTGGGSLQAQNELLRIQSTHTALTWDAVQVGDRIAREGEAPFDVLYVIDGAGRRMNQLFLDRKEKG